MLRAGLKFLIKDALRGARYTMRRSRGVGAPLDFPARELKRIADNVLTSIEETVVTLRYGSDQADDMIRTALLDYSSLPAAIGGHDFESRFASTNYRLSKAILMRRGLDAIYISELVYAGAARRVARQAQPQGSEWRPSLFAAEVAGALIEAAPIRRSRPANDADAKADVFRSRPNEACAFAIGLAISSWLSKDGINAVDCAESASAIAGAAFGRMETALHGPDATLALAAIFEELAAFVP